MATQSSIEPAPHFKKNLDKACARARVCVLPFPPSLARHTNEDTMVVVSLMGRVYVLPMAMPPSTLKEWLFRKSGWLEGGCMGRGEMSMG